MCHQATMAVCCQTPLVAPITPKICTGVLFNIVNPNFQSDLLSGNSRNTSFKLSNLLRLGFHRCHIMGRWIYKCFFMITINVPSHAAYVETYRDLELLETKEYFETFQFMFRSLLNTQGKHLYSIGGLVRPLLGSVILLENPGTEIYQIHSFANSLCYK